MTIPIDYEKIAAQIHEYYRLQAIKEGWKNDFPMLYPELPEFMKSDNRAAARRIGQVLSLAGLRLVPNKGAPWPLTDQACILALIEDNIDLLGEGEHEGWTEARLRNGWRLGPCKDVAKRESHLFAPWSQFEHQIQIKRDHLEALGQPPTKPLNKEMESELNKDRDSVRNYVKIIAGTDYRIVEEVR